jgi:hypothetical protein
MLAFAAGSVVFWDYRIDSWVERACAIAGRNLSEVEWAQYFPGEEYRATCPQWSAGP